jgi:hypothetical protein
VSELGDLLELLHRGGRSFETVRLAALQRINTQVGQRAAEAWRANQPAGRVSSVRAYGPGNAPLPEMLEIPTRLWLQRPDSVREEMGGRYPHYGVRVGETWWMFDEHSGALTNEGDPNHGAGIGDQLEAFLQPAPLIPHFDFEVHGPLEYLGRRALRVSAHRRSSDPHSHFHIPIPIGTDDCELIVDCERGVLLRIKALFEGEEAMSMTIEEIGFDEPLDPSIFIFMPPEGETLQRTADRPQSRHQPLEAVASAASFTVYVVPELEEGWRMSAMHLLPSRQHRHEQVYLHYYRDDASHQFNINESRADASERASFTPLETEPEHLNRDGVELEVVRSSEQLPLAVVRLTRGTTAIELMSDNLDADWLIAAALRLEPAR